MSNIELNQNNSKDRPTTGAIRIINDAGVIKTLDSRGNKNVLALIPDKNSATLPPGPLILSSAPNNYVAGTPQVITATFTAAAGATSAGNLSVTITGANINGSPVTVLVPLTTDMNTATLVATQIATLLGANSAIAAKYAVTNSGATVILTSLLPLSDDDTLAITITAGLGVTAISTAQTTEGVANNAGTPGVPGQEAIVSGAEVYKCVVGLPQPVWTHLTHS